MENMLPRASGLGCAMVLTPALHARERARSTPAPGASSREIGAVRSSRTHRATRNETNGAESHSLLLTKARSISSTSWLLLAYQAPLTSGRRRAEGADPLPGQRDVQADLSPHREPTLRVPRHAAFSAGRRARDAPAPSKAMAPGSAGRWQPAVSHRRARGRGVMAAGRRSPQSTRARGDGSRPLVTAEHAGAG